MGLALVVENCRDRGESLCGEVDPESLGGEGVGVPSPPGIIEGTCLA